MIRFHVMRLAFASILVVAATLVTAHSVHAALSFDAAEDFSLSSNPNGAWSYGYSATVGGTFQLFPQSAMSFRGDPNFDTWYIADAATSSVQHPFAAKNRTAVTQQSFGLKLPPGGLGLHPGPDATNEYSIIRWSASTDGMYQIDAAFTDRDASDPLFVTPGATTDVHVLVNGSSVYDAIINRDGWGLGPSGYSASLTVAMGDTIDFVVGRGQNDTFASDSTGLEATMGLIVPEPSTAVMVLFGLLLFIADRRLARAFE